VSAENAGGGDAFRKECRPEDGGRNGHLRRCERLIDHQSVWWRTGERLVEKQLLLDLARMMMRIDAKLDMVLEILGEDFGEEEMDT
jgi:hypothetical protein